MHFFDTENRILRDNYKSSILTAENVSAITASLTLEKISSSVCEEDHYPKLSDINGMKAMSDIKHMTTELWMRLLNTLSDRH